MKDRLRLLYALQRIDTSLDELHELKGDLPRLVGEMETQLLQKSTAQKELEGAIKQSFARREEIDLEIISTKERIERYKEQQFQIKTNRQYDALTREIDLAQAHINNLEREMEIAEGRAATAKADMDKLLPELEELAKELEDRRTELHHLNKEHEDEELRLKHEREKLTVRIEKGDLRLYERIRKAMRGKAVVPVRRNACGGCFKRVPPQVGVELRKNSRLMACEHCGRLLVSYEIVESFSSAL